MRPPNPIQLTEAFIDYNVLFREGVRLVDNARGCIGPPVRSRDIVCMSRAQFAASAGSTDEYLQLHRIGTEQPDTLSQLLRGHRILVQRHPERLLVKADLRQVSR